MGWLYLRFGIGSRGHKPTKFSCAMQLANRPMDSPALGEFEPCSWCLLAGSELWGCPCCCCCWEDDLKAPAGREAVGSPLLQVAVSKSFRNYRHVPVHNSMYTEVLCWNITSIIPGLSRGPYFLCAMLKNIHIHFLYVSYRNSKEGIPILRVWKSLCSHNTENYTSVAVRFGGGGAAQ